MTERISQRPALQRVRARRAEILELARRRKAYDVRVFGSLVRGDETPASDVDFLVRFEPGYRLLDHVGLQVDLERLLGCAVDVANEAALRDELREDILAEAEPL